MKHRRRRLRRLRKMTATKVRLDSIPAGWVVGSGDWGQSVLADPVARAFTAAVTGLYAFESGKEPRLVRAGEPVEP